MDATAPPPADHSPDEADPSTMWVLSARALRLESAELHLREAGRRLEVLGAGDPEHARLARVIFRLASRVRTDRMLLLEGAA